MTILEIPDELTVANHEAAESFVTQEERDALMNRRSRSRKETWTKLERMVRLATGRYGKE